MYINENDVIENNKKNHATILLGRFVTSCQRHVTDLIPVAEDNDIKIKLC